jgi:hypothetical protein
MLKAYPAWEPYTMGAARGVGLIALCVYEPFFAIMLHYACAKSQ